MDLVRELKEVRFELSLRGYDCEAVDAFLAKLRTDVALAQGNSETAQARISELEQQIEDGGGSSETEGTLRRTLVLAQRLADETEAEAKSAAAELIEAATAEAATLRSTAEVEASGMRESGETELKAAREEAERVNETTNEQAAKGRAEARQQVEAILNEAEIKGRERVAVIEQSAQEEAAGMRTPIREEVAELESVRARLLGDISALEQHLEQQRVRVRTAVEALRVGMSGSIEDLERVADNDDLLATQPSPGHSGAAGADVDVAPDIEIAARVDESVPEASTVDDVEAAALAGIEPIADEDTTPSEASVEMATVDDEVADTVFAGAVSIEDEAVLVEDSEDVLNDAEDVFDGAENVFADVVADDAPVEVEGVSDAEVIIDDAEIVEVEVDGLHDEGPRTEPIPVVVMADEADLAEAELIDLDHEPDALFGTDLGADANVVASESAIHAGAAVTAGAAFAGVSGSDVGEDVVDAEPVVDDGGVFTDRFAQALDVLPVAGDS